MNIVKLFTLVKEVKETENVEEINKLIKKDWIVLSILPRKEKNTLYTLGKINLSKIHLPDELLI